MKEKSLIKKLRAAADALQEVYALLHGAETSVTAAKLRKTFVKRDSAKILHWTQRPENAAKVKAWKKSIRNGRYGKESA